MQICCTVLARFERCHFECPISVLILFNNFFCTSPTSLFQQYFACSSKYKQIGGIGQKVVQRQPDRQNLVRLSRPDVFLYSCSSSFSSLNFCMKFETKFHRLRLHVSASGCKLNFLTTAKLIHFHTTTPDTRSPGCLTPDFPRFATCKTLNHAPPTRE